MVRSRSRLAGILLLIAGVSLFAALDGLSKMLGGLATISQMMLARYALGLPILLATIPPGQWMALPRTTRPWSQLARAVLPVLVSVIMVVSVQHLPLAETTVILFAGPFFVIALSGPVLGEKPPISSWIGVIFGFLAVLIVMRPGLSTFSPLLLLPLVGAVLFAFFQLISGSLAASGERGETTLAWNHGIGLFLCLPFALYDWQPLTAFALLLCLFSGLTFAFGHLLIVKAYERAPANVLAPFTYSQIITAVLFGVLAFGDVPDAWTFVGIGLMIASGIYLVRVER